MILDAWGWCTGKTQRDGMGREGGGFRMRNTCMPGADSFRYMADQYNIVKFKNKIKLKITTTTKVNVWQNQFNIVK